MCTVEELAAAMPHPLPVRLLGQDYAVADLGEPGAPELVAALDRCPHRSTKLSVGHVDTEAATLRCAYHGWQFDPAGRCVDIPSMPGVPIPERACLTIADAELAYGLVWLRPDAGADTTIPANPAWAHAGFPSAAATNGAATNGAAPGKRMKVLAGAPYTWPTSAPRRVENFVDLAHFAWVHDGTLGDRNDPVPPVPEVRREAGELRFQYDPPEIDTEPTALFGHQRYRMPMPLTVDIEFFLPTGARRRLWMTASPVDDATARSFWFVARDDDLEGDDAEHMAFQDLILAQDEPVVCNQNPPQIPLDPSESGFVELSVRTDRVSIEYRRWLREIATAGSASDPVGALRTVLENGHSADVFTEVTHTRQAVAT